MKSVDIETTSLGNCVNSAQTERVVVTRGGQPVALVVGVEGLDAEQVELGSDAAFWRLIADRRKQPGVQRAELERRLGAADGSHPGPSVEENAT